MKKGIYFLLLISFNVYSQQVIDTLQGTKQVLDEVIVQSVRVKYSSPISHSNISSKRKIN